jgi:hypothetical protein
VRRIRRTFCFAGDPFGAKYTFAEVTSALPTAEAAGSLARACRIVRARTTPEVAPRIIPNVRCPKCLLTIPETLMRKVVLSNGDRVTLYPHPATAGGGIGRVCREVTT